MLNNLVWTILGRSERERRISWTNAEELCHYGEGIRDSIEFIEGLLKRTAQDAVKDRYGWFEVYRGSGHGLA